MCHIGNKFLVDFIFVTKKYVMLSLPSSVVITLERGSNRSAEPIDLKIGLDIGNYGIHV